MASPGVTVEEAIEHIDIGKFKKPFLQTVYTVNEMTLPSEPPGKSQCALLKE